jgi:hypothetical protein
MKPKGHHLVMSLSSYRMGTLNRDIEAGGVKRRSLLSDTEVSSTHEQDAEFGATEPISHIDLICGHHHISGT